PTPARENAGPSAKPRRLAGRAGERCSPRTAPAVGGWQARAGRGSAAELERELLRAAPDRERALARLAERLAQAVGVRDVLAIDLEDDVSLAQAGARAVAVGLEVGDDRARRRLGQAELVAVEERQVARHGVERGELGARRVLGRGRRLGELDLDLLALAVVEDGELELL